MSANFCVMVAIQGRVGAIVAARVNRQAVVDVPAANGEIAEEELVGPLAMVRLQERLIVAAHASASQQSVRASLTFDEVPRHAPPTPIDREMIGRLRQFCA